MTNLLEASERLLAWFRPFPSCAVALSGGVDSALVAAAAHRALGDAAWAFTGMSPSLAEAELAAARRIAEHIGIRHHVIETYEFRNERYVRNAPDRCYHCKTELYTQIERWRAEWDVAVVVNGANQDDLSDFRPGMRAAAEHGVRSPLAECGFGKELVRALARLWQLPVWDKPASPCLSSRIAYGEQVTPERLSMIERAESFLRELGFGNVRVRYHRGDMARIEVTASEIAELTGERHRRRIVDFFTQIGFRYVSVDLAGFRSGSLNAFIGEEALRAAATPGSSHEDAHGG